MNPAWYALAIVPAYLAWLLLSPLVINRGLVVGPWIGGWTRSKGYRWPWLGRKGKGWTIRFKSNGSLHGVLDYSFRIPRGATKLVWRYRIEGANVSPTEALTSPALVSLVLQRRGDDWSAKGEKASYRLYSPTAFPVADGEYAYAIDLASWTNVWGQPADMAPVIANLSNLAVAFGHSAGRMHGVSGKGTFTLVSLEAI